MCSDEQKKTFTIFIPVRFCSDIDIIAHNLIHLKKMKYNRLLWLYQIFKIILQTFVHQLWSEEERQIVS